MLWDKPTVIQQSPASAMAWIKELESGEGSTYQDYVFLFGLVTLLQPKRILEIGTNHGASSIVMSLASREVGVPCEIDTIDPDPQKADRAKQQFERWGVADQINVVVGSSLEVLPTLKRGNRKYDLAFVDGDHSYEGCRADLELVRGMAELAVVHDSQHMASVRRCIEEIGAPQSLLLDCPTGQQYSSDKIVWRSAPGFALLKL